MVYSQRPTLRFGGRRPIAVAAATMITLLLGGCANFSADGGFGEVQRASKQRLDKELVYARTEADLRLIAQRVAELLAAPLTADAAVQIALFNNRGLLASFQELGIAEADLVQVGRLPNPGFSFGRLARGTEIELERGLHFNLARLLAMPLIGEVQTRRFQQTQGAVTLAVLSLASETRKAWVHAVAAQEALRYSAQVMQAA